MSLAGTLSDYQFMRRHTGSTKRAEKAKEAWGASLNSLQDVYRVFTKYTSGAPPIPLAIVVSWFLHLAYLSSAVLSQHWVLQAHGNWHVTLVQSHALFIPSSGVRMLNKAALRFACQATVLCCWDCRGGS